MLIEMEQPYLDLLKEVLATGDVRETRNATTYSIFGPDLMFDLSSFPLLTTKKMFFRGIIEELLFFLRGETDSKILESKGITIWSKNAPNGNIGPMYGFQWRHFGADIDSANQFVAHNGIDQLEQLIHDLCHDPTSRRLIMTSFDPRNVHQGVLWPCHGLTIQFYVIQGKLSCKMYQRSADVFLGLPFNIASYAALVSILCAICTNRGTSLIPGKLFISLGDVHLYTLHKTMAEEQLLRQPYPFPQLRISTTATKVEELSFNDFLLTEYVHHPAIKAEMIP